ncbi:O-antigen ligase family protein [Micromonospora sp. NBC_01813]|uniref:O-antigen ligase family protein n=1 Tax=Micromonospora sp. NBC_01813 TaxID=2975988 RepID=UPI002DDC107E|nr:O-antigen ligase family protein [Micromonospora sp. NBC_01813]WSA11609.1 hypothetical protein OG958_12950 [Micromonospora sp. NBC_01813]
MKSIALLPPALVVAGTLAAGAVMLPASAPLAEVVPGGPVSGPRDLGLLALAAVACCVAFTAWPWSVLPTAIIGVLGVLILLGDNSIPVVLGLHGFLLAAGCAGLSLRRLFLPERRSRATAVADGPMAVLAGLIVVAACYGFLLGNDPAQILIAGYHFAVIPVYYFLATCTLTTPQWRHRAAVLFVVGAAGFTVLEMAAPGRHGGSWALLAAVPLVVLSCQAAGWRRVGLLALAALFLADVVLAAYRTTWTLAGVAVLGLLVLGTARIRRTAGALLALTALLVVVGIAVSPGIRERSMEMTTAMETDAGHRMPEAKVGFETFLANPLTGAGLGQSTPDVYLPGNEVTDVGPLYHLYYAMVLANLGIFGLLALLWPILRALRAGLAQRDGIAFAFAVLILGFLVSVSFSGPATGHWALGLLPALVLLTRRADPAAGPTSLPAQSSTETYTHARSRTGSRTLAAVG